MRKLITLIAIGLSLTMHGQYKKEPYGLMFDSADKNGWQLWNLRKEHGEVYAPAARIHPNSDTLIIPDTTWIKSIEVNGKVYSVRDLAKRDTVSIPVYIKERVDTSKQTTIIYEGRKGRIYRTNGYFIYMTLVGTIDGKSFQALDRPKIVGAVDEKKRPVKPILQ